MKRIFILSVLLLTAASVFAQTGKSIYEKYSVNDNVSAVYISPAMFRIIGKIPDLKVEDGNVDLAPVISQLTGMYILDSQNKSINANLKSEVSQFISKGKFELMMEAKDNGQVMRIYTIGDQKTVTGFVLFSEEEEETSFICIEGKMDRAQLEQILSSQMK